MAIFRYFKMGPAAILDLLFTTFETSIMLRMTAAITVQNLGHIALTVAEKQQFF
jgi:hypothetical protein